MDNEGGLPKLMIPIPMNRLAWLLPLRYSLHLLLVLVTVRVVLRVGQVDSEQIFIPLAVVSSFAAAVLTDHSFRRTGSWAMFQNLGMPRFASLAALVLVTSFLFIMIWRA